MPNAEIITIGTEILLGEIVDTNSRHIARALRDQGIDIYRLTSIGDNVQRIADTIQESLARADIVITTGGLGPTVDDPTREAVALAFGVETVFHETLWQQVLERFARFDRTPTENNRRQAYLPRGALAIENPVGTAPAFMMEAGDKLVICLPGVPREMEHLLQEVVIPTLRERFHIQEVLKVRILHTAGVGESQIDARIGDLETRSNPTVGLAAHAGRVDMRITAKAATAAEADRLIEKVESELRARLGDWIYGADAEALEWVAMRSLRARGWNLVALEAGLGGELLRRLTNLPHTFLRGEALPHPPPDPEDLLAMTSAYRQAHHADVGLGVALYHGTRQHFIHLALITPETTHTHRVPYGGPPKLAARRATNLALNLLRPKDRP